MRQLTREKVEFVLKWLLCHPLHDSFTGINQSSYLHADYRHILFDDYSEKYYKEELNKKKGDWKIIENNMKYIYGILITYGLIEKCVGALFMGGTNYYLIDNLLDEFVFLELPDNIKNIIQERKDYILKRMQ